MIALINAKPTQDSLLIPTETIAPSSPSPRIILLPQPQELPLLVPVVGQTAGEEFLDGEVELGRLFHDALDNIRREVDQPHDFEEQGTVDGFLLGKRQARFQRILLPLVEELIPQNEPPPQRREAIPFELLPIDDLVQGQRVPVPHDIDGDADFEVAVHERLNCALLH